MLDLITNEKIDIIVNTPSGKGEKQKRRQLFEKSGDQEESSVCNDNGSGKSGSKRNPYRKRTRKQRSEITSGTAQ